MKTRAGWLAFGGLGYVVAVFLVTQLAIANGFLAGLGLPARVARSGAYDFKGPEVAALDPDQIARSVGEASGGPPTIASPPPTVASKSDASPAPSQQPPPQRAVVPVKTSTTAAVAPPAVPTTIAAFIASLPPSWQATLQAAIQKNQVSLASLAAFIASLPPNWQASLQAEIQKSMAPGD